MLTDAQTAQFADRGYLRLSGAFPQDAAKRMEERIWSGLERRHGIRRDDPSTWLMPLGTGLQSLRTASAFDPIGGEPLTRALDDLIGESGWQPPRHWGQFLVNFPNRDEEWNVPWRLWHTDFPYYLPRDRLVGALVFSFINLVPHRTGATMIVSGSHRLVARFVQARPELRKVKMKVTRQALVASEPWLKELSSQGDVDSREQRFMQTEEDVGGIAVRVLELTGEPGDVVICHPWMLHSGSTNSGEGPRFMRVQRVRQKEAPIDDPASSAAAMGAQ